MATVGDVLNCKGHDVYHVDPDASVLAALEIMAEHDLENHPYFDAQESPLPAADAPMEERIRYVLTAGGIIALHGGVVR